MKILAKLAPLSLALALGGCGPEEPSVRYSGNTLPPKALQHVKVYRATRPERPFEELGTVQVSCPTKAQAGMFGSVHIEGGCTLETALQMAVERAAMAGADGLVGLDTTAGGNGNVVALTAVALRFTGAAPAVAEKAPAVAEKAPAAGATPSLEQRLKRLQEMSQQGLISAEDFERRKAEILKEL